MLQLVVLNATTKYVMTASMRKDAAPNAKTSFAANANMMNSFAALAVDVTTAMIVTRLGISADAVKPAALTATRVGMEIKCTFCKFKLFSAAKNGDVATVKALRESGVDVIGSRQDDGMSSILLACKNGHIDLLNHLLEQGANPNDVENYGGTCLMAAACYRHPDCVRRLIDAGADVEYVYPGDNASVIYMAAYCFSKDVEEDRSLDFEEGSVVRTVELLLEAGAPGNTPCIDRETSRRKTALQVLQGMLPFNDKVERERDGLIALLQA